MKNCDYVNGIISSIENKLLFPKFSHLVELSAEEAFKVVIESGYGYEAEVSNVGDYKLLIESSEKQFSNFIKEYGSLVEQSFFLLENDYRNLEGIIKANILDKDKNDFIGLGGLYSPQEIIKKYEEKSLTGYMAKVVEEVSNLVEEELTGANIGGIVRKNYYLDLLSKVKGKVLRKIIDRKAIAENIFTTFRSKDFSVVQKYYVPCSVKVEKFEELLNNSPITEKAKSFGEMENLVLIALQKGYTEAEKYCDIFMIDFYIQNKYELSSSEPIIFYGLKRNLENKNVSILFSCLLAKIKPKKILERIRLI